jgi:hypothetical protein
VTKAPEPRRPQPDAQSGPPLPQPSPEFRRRAWMLFQRVLDPLALPKSPPRHDAPRRKG